MNKPISIVAVTTILAAVTLAAQSKNNPHAQIASMDWIAGSWEGPIMGGTFRAYYTTPEGGKVISYNELIKDGKTAFYEFELFRVEDGKVVFNPFPGGKKVTPLTLTECVPAEMRVAFENPNKDFPTRIEYHRVAPDRLVITLADPHNKSDKTQVYDLRRVPEQLSGK
jgi:Domain of unknown function (DUF6265)